METPSTKINFVRTRRTLTDSARTSIIKFAFSFK